MHFSRLPCVLHAPWFHPLINNNTKWTVAATIGIEPEAHHVGLKAGHRCATQHRADGLHLVVLGVERDVINRDEPRHFGETANRPEKPAICTHKVYQLSGSFIRKQHARDVQTVIASYEILVTVTTLKKHTCRSQWPRRPRHVRSSTARSLVSWVRIPLEVWMCVLVFFCVVLSCVVTGLATGRSPVQGVLPNVQNRFINFRS